jgi:hypothetical protein
MQEAESLYQSVGNALEREPSPLAAEISQDLVRVTSSNEG